MNRATFLQNTALAGAAVLLSSLESFAKEHSKIIKVAIIGCGSVSNRYIPHLQTSSLVKIVGLCDIIHERALGQNKQYNVGALTFSSIEDLLKGVDFDLMLTLTDMQMHGALNRKALMAGKNVWSEKPLANTYEEGKQLVDLAKAKNIRIWGAPAVVTSPQFVFMSKTIQSGKLGKLADCENLVPLYSKDFEKNKDDIDWVKKAASRLSVKECTEEPLFLKLVKQLDNLAPTSESKLYLSQLERNKGNISKSIEYLEESAEMQSNNSKKSRIYFRIAELKRNKGSYRSARSYYNKSLKYNPSNGRCYLRIAQMYSKSSNDCGNSVFEKRAVNWLAANMADKAVIVDASIKSEARAAANSYRQRAPSKSDIFTDGMAGKTISFNCWIGGSVKVPNL